MLTKNISPKLKVIKLRSIQATKRSTSKKKSTINHSRKSSLVPTPRSQRGKSTERQLSVYLNPQFNSGNSTVRGAISMNRSQIVSIGERKEESPKIRSRMSLIRHKSASIPSKEFEEQFPLSPQKSLNAYKHLLTSFEKQEISDYRKIYFLGLNAKKVKSDSNKDNFGYDDEKSNYRVVHGDHIAYRYEILEILGKGSFGLVVKCLDHKLKQWVALKIIRNQKRFHRQGKVEVKILKMIAERDQSKSSHSIEMKSCFVFRKHLCITFELLSINLYELLRSNCFQGFSVTLVRRFAIQILACLCFLKQNKIIHCDLKPENILLKNPEKSGIKVIDFGSSCLEDEKIYTYIQSRFYRAPEIMLGIPYTTSIDMWSLGCICAELHSGYPLFTGKNENEQLSCIIEVLGLPPRHILKLSTRKNLFHDISDHSKLTPTNKKKLRLPGARVLQEKVRSKDYMFVDFLEKCLDWDPQGRIQPEEALSHPWIKEGLSEL